MTTGSDRAGARNSSAAGAVAAGTAQETVEQFVEDALLGGVARIVAARGPARLRTLTLTNCDTHDRVPSEVFLPTVRPARAGLLAPLAHRLLADPAGSASRRTAGCARRQDDRVTAAGSPEGSA